MKTGFVSPYADITERLVGAISSGLAICYERLAQSYHASPSVDRSILLQQAREAIDSIDDGSLSSLFSWLADSRPGTPAKDRHLFTGPNPRATIRGSKYEFRSRISGLIKGAVVEALEEDRGTTTSMVYIPSALAIALDFLTDPNEPASRAFGFFAVRRYLQESCGVPSLNPLADQTGSVTYEVIADRLGTLATHLQRGDAADHTSRPEAYFIYHFLAMRRILFVRFTASLSEGGGSNPDKRNTRLEAALLAAISYLKDGQVVPSEDLFQRQRGRGRGTAAPKLEFVTSAFIDRLPDASILFNDIHSVPLAVRGAEAVFQGGLLPSKNLVLGVRGHAGAGKTSFGLSLASVLAPFGAKTLYVSAEESPRTLRARLETITPLYLRATSFFDETFSWFRAENLVDDDVDDDRQPRVAKLRHFLRQLRLWLSEAHPEAAQADQAPPFRFLVVLDSVHSYFHTSSYRPRGVEFVGPTYTIDSFIRECSELNAMVAVISSADEAVISPIDYLADVAIELDYRQTMDPMEKPFRLFILKKTRHQASQPGAHTMHISGGKGFRLSPQLFAQMERAAARSQRHPNTKGTEGWYDILCRNFSDSTAVAKEELRPLGRPSNFLRLFPDSHILVHGTGSGGKAGLGLKVLTAPLMRKSEDPAGIIDQAYVPRVLVVSFLYQRELYDARLQEIATILPLEYGSTNRVREHVRKLSRTEALEVVHCYPGHLRAEDLFSKIETVLVRADLEGLPFTGILLDGLHNVFMQFPELEKYQMFWPMLYALLRTKKNLTVVTTHTTIAVGPLGDEYEYKIRQDRPFLQALIQATDFYLELHPLEPPLPHTRLFELTAKSSIGQPIPTSSVYWSRETLTSSVGRRLVGGQLDLPIGG